jgi:hypothetical protein
MSAAGQHTVKCGQLWPECLGYLARIAADATGNGCGRKC